MEHTYFHVRYSAVILALKLIFLSLIFNILYLVVSVISDTYTYFNNGFVFHQLTYDTFTFLGLILLELTISVSWLFRWYHHSYSLTDTHLIYYRGWFIRQTIMIEVARIDNVNITQSSFGHWFDYGTIMVHSLGTTLKMHHVPYPQYLVQTLNNVQRKLSSNT